MSVTQLEVEVNVSRSYASFRELERHGLEAGLRYI